MSIASKNKMATVPIKKLMLTMGLPMILSMALQALYNIVDSAFVSNMPQNGEEALNALTLAFPIQMLMVSVSIGTGVGVNALVSRSLGQGDREQANKAAGNALFLAGIIYIAFLLFGLFGVPSYIASQTGNLQIAKTACTYLSVCCVVSFGIAFFSVYEKLLQATGRSLFSTIAQIAGAVTNIVLDPILIYGLCGCPALGAAGAAYATVIGQIVSLVLALIFHLTVNKEIQNGWRYVRPRGRVIKQIYTIGLPAIIAQALMSVMTYGLNIILGQIDESAVTAYGLYYKIQQFVLFAAFGLRDAITPIVSFNYGRNSTERIKDGIRFGLLYTVGIMLVGLVVLELFAEPLTGVFGLSGQTQELCVSAMRIISLSFLCAGINIAAQGIFQAMEGGVQSLVISVCRQFLFVLPVAWAFSAAIGYALESTWTVWLTFPIAETVTAVFAVLMLKHLYKQKVAVKG
ncbi:MAG: MATE family efflux transporter [Acutalibacteraceae bacterium]